MIKITNTFELKQFIDNQIDKSTDTNYVDVFPLPCGIGKSTYIKYAIYDALTTNRGLIVVTDSVERLNSYAQDDEDLLEYVKRNQNQIAILSSETITEELKTLYKKPIVLLTTQRFFSLSKAEITDLTKYQYGVRNKIFIDEKPYLLETKTLTIKSLNDIDTALHQALDDTVNQAEKEWLINQWQAFNRKLQQTLKANECENKGYKREYYFKLDGLTISEDDLYFNHLIDKYRKQLNRFNPNILKDIAAVNQLLKEGIITSQKAKKAEQEYSNFFTVVLNHSDKLINVGAKVYVFDGTADISPEYSLNYIKIINCKDFKCDLRKLTINIVDVNTSKSIICKNNAKTEKLLNQLIQYIKSLPNKNEGIFTYKDIEKKFKNDFEIVSHFGDIKGRNHYRDVTNITQVGLNRMPDLLYMLYANEIGCFNDKWKTIVNRIYDEATTNIIMCKQILADIEQNLFRSAIRNRDNLKEVTYTLIFDVSQYQLLVNLIQRRYGGMGARVNVIDRPIEFKLLKAEERKQDTNVQKILNWLSYQSKDYIFKIDIMLDNLNLTQRQFQKIKSKNPAIKELFQKMQISKGVYNII